MLGAEGEAEDMGVEVERARVVGADDGYVVDAAEGEGHDVIFVLMSIQIE